jgi:hypothetical protein
LFYFYKLTQVYQHERSNNVRVSNTISVAAVN